MSHTPESICNLACVELGTGQISSLAAPGNDRERKFAIVYPQAVRAELRKRRWNFAKTYRNLTADPTLVHPELANGYRLPASCVRPLRPQGADWVVAGRVIYTDSSAPLAVTSIDRVDESIFDDLFVDVLKFRVAIDMCTDRTQSNAVFVKCSQGYTEAVAAAGKADAFEKGAISPPLGDWVSARFI